jgi:glycosidase
MTMLDVVGNHMGHSRSESFADIKPFNKPQHYHKRLPGCDQWGSIPQSAYDARPANATLIEQCRLQSLPDLNQSVPFVRDQLLSWLDRTLQKYDFDGLRVDTVKHVDPVRALSCCQSDCTLQFHARGLRQLRWQPQHHRLLRLQARYRTTMCAAVEM